MKLLTIFFLFFLPVNSFAFDKWVKHYSDLYGVEKNVVDAVIFAESSGRVNIDGDDGKSFGLMQVQYETSRDLGFRGTEKQLLYPYYNLKYGIKYIVQCLEWSKGDVCVAIDMYNRGIKNVRDYPYKGKWENHRHLKKIVNWFKLRGKLHELQNNCAKENW